MSEVEVCSLAYEGKLFELKTKLEAKGTLATAKDSVIAQKLFITIIIFISRASLYTIVERSENSIPFLNILFKVLKRTKIVLEIPYIKFH